MLDNSEPGTGLAFPRVSHPLVPLKNSILIAAAGLTAALVLSTSNVTAAVPDDPPPSPAPEPVQTLSGEYLILKPDGTPPVPGYVATATVIYIPLTGKYLGIFSLNGTPFPPETSLISGGPNQFTWVNRGGNTGSLDRDADTGEVESEADQEEEDGEKDRVWIPL